MKIGNDPMVENRFGYRLKVFGRCDVVSPDQSVSFCTPNEKLDGSGSRPPLDGLL